MRIYLKKLNGYLMLIKGKCDSITITSENCDKKDVVDNMYTLYIQEMIKNLVPEHTNFINDGIYEIKVTKEIEKIMLRRKIILEFNYAFEEAIKDLSDMKLLHELDDINISYVRGDLSITGKWEDGYVDCIV